MHVSVQFRESTATAAERRELIDLTESVFSERPAMRRNDLEGTFKKRLKVAESSAYRKAARMIELEVIKKTVAGLYVMSANKES